MNQPTVMIPANSRLVSLFPRYSRGASATGILVGASVLVGWLLDIPLLKSVIPGLVTMKANTALCFIVAGVALRLLENEAAPPPLRRVAQGCAVTVSLIGVVTLSEYLFGWDLGIDQLLIEESSGAVLASLPGRMAPVTAVSFLFIGFALFSLHVKTSRGAAPAQFLALATAAISFFSFAGYLFSVDFFHGIASYTAVALHTPVTFFALSAGVLLARPDRGLMSTITSNGPGSFMARRLLPISISIPLVIGWLLLKGEQAGLYSDQFEMALLVLMIIIIFSTLVYWNASAQNRHDAERLQAETALRKSEEIQRSLFEHAPDAILVTDQNGRIVQANTQAEATFGYRREELVGQSVDLLVPECSRAAHVKHRAHYHSQTRTRSTALGNLHARRKDGSEVPVDISLSPANQDGELLVISIIRDVSERRKAEHAIRQHAQEIQSLHEIGQTIINSVDLQTVLDGILEKALTLDAFDIGIIRLLDATGKTLTVASSRGYREPESIRPVSIDLKDPTVGRAQAEVFESRGAYIVESVPASSAFRTFKAEGVESSIVVPVRAGAEIIGTMQLGSRTPRTFKPEEVHLFEAIGHQLGIAVQKTKLHKANQQALKEIEALYAVTTSATQSLNLNTVLQMVIRKVTEIFGFDATRVFLFDPSMQTLVLEASYETSPEKFSEVRSFRRGQGVVGRAAESAEPIIFEDVRSDPRYAAMSHSANSKTVGFRFFAVFPIPSKGRTIGVVAFFQNKPRSLSSGESKLLMAMAAQIGIAVENARLFEETCQRADELTQKTFDLEKSNRAKDEFLAMISHELRTPLNVIMGYTGLVREGMFGALSPQQDDALKKVAIQSNDLLSIVSNLLRATQIGSGEIKAERARTDLGQLLDEIKTAYDLPATDELTLNWDVPSDLPTVETDSEKLKHILVNLINNAIKFTDKGSVTIAARHLPRSKTLRFTVADTGPGIARESLPIIFDMFHQLDGSNTRAHGGLGLGLYIVKKYTELLGGKIKVKSVPGRGSVFRVALPYESSLCPESILPAVTPESRIVDPWMTES